MEVFDLGDGLIVLSAIFVSCSVVPAIVGAYLAARRGRSWILGAVCGLFLSWIGVLILSLLGARGVRTAGGSQQH